MAVDPRQVASEWLIRNAIDQVLVAVKGRMNHDLERLCMSIAPKRISQADEVLDGPEVLGRRDSRRHQTVVEKPAVQILGPGAVWVKMPRQPNVPNPFFLGYAQQNPCDSPFDMNVVV